jgi:hypothetical protein
MVQEVAALIVIHMILLELATNSTKSNLHVLHNASASNTGGAQIGTFGTVLMHVWGREVFDAEMGAYK